MMYGSEKTDWVVKYYDLAFGITGDAERKWYLNKIKESGGPVLDLCCGTGRFALMLANQGYEVVGVDQSVGMLNQFKEKLRSQPPDVRERVRIENQKLSDFNLGKKFKTVICCDAFFHNLTVEDEINCLQNVAHHLLSSGRFVFNLHNPNCEFILKSVASGGVEFEERGRYEIEDGSGTLLVEQARAGNMNDQCTTTTLRLTEYDREGYEVDKSESTWTTRYMFRYEAVHLLYRCGFKVQSLVGDYRNGPVTQNSQLIFDVKLNDEWGVNPKKATRLKT